MRKNSTTRRSSTIPTRIPTNQREDPSLSRGDGKKSQSKSRSPTRHSHIPRARFRSSSSDGAEFRRSNFKATGKTPLKNAPTTPVTPATRLSIKQRSGSVGVLNCYTGRRSPSSDRGSVLGSKSVRKDTRCLADKSYQTVMINKIEKYIKDHNGSQISLKPMTLSMFVDISNLLLETLKVKPPLTLNNYIENLPKIAKRLNYPGTVTKSWLKTANAPHSLPQVLGWLSWLVEICHHVVNAKERLKFENLPSRESTGSNSNTLCTWLKMYSAWNSVNLEEEEASMKEFLVEIKNASGVDEECLQKARAESKRMEHQLQIVENKSKQLEMEVDKSRNTLAELQNNVDQVDKEIAHERKTLDTENKEIERLNADFNNLLEQKSSLIKRRDDVRSIIKNQPMSRIEKDSILKKCSDLENHNNTMQKMLMDSKKQLYELRMKSSSMAIGLKKSVIAYNDFIMRLDCDAFGIKINKDELLFPEKTLLDEDTIDIINSKEKFWKELIKSFENCLHKYECLIEKNDRENLTTLKKINEGEENCKQLEKQLEVMKNHMEETEKNRKIETDRLNNDIERLRSEIERDEGEIKILKTNPLQEELEEAKEKLEAIVKRKTFLQESAHRFFEEFYSITADHREKLAKILKDPPND